MEYPGTTRHAVQRFLSIGLLCLLTACGGGSSSGGDTPTPLPPDPPDPPSPPPEATTEELIDAAKFASRASFGLTYSEIEAIAESSHSDWLIQQFSLPGGRHTPTVLELISRREAGEFENFEVDIEYLVQFRRLAWWNCAVNCTDTLRQRVAYALSQIFVVSDNVDVLIVYPTALSSYYDVLIDNAFGNFRDLLFDVAMHPSMGVYLSHVNNNKSNPQLNTFPDENFAREVMQLFSIGLFELNIDGSNKLSSNGQVIPTYDNDDIREFAKIFTGLSYSGPNAFFGSQEVFFLSPMRMFEDNHEPGEKYLLNGQVVPAGQSGLEDINAAIDNLFNHANTGPFIAKQLIQRLVTSNPSPAYVERVARVFNGDASGIRGDMKDVITAILTDSEATMDREAAENFGKLREPIVRHLAVLRQFGTTNSTGFFAENGYFVQFLTQQHPLSSPSVFNFYLPNHMPAGELANASLVAPEFQITNSNSIINLTNFLDYLLAAEDVTNPPQPFEPSQLVLDEYLELAADVDQLIDRLDVMLTHGSLNPLSRDVVRSVIVDFEDPAIRLRLALFMIITSPDYAIEY